MNEEEKKALKLIEDSLNKKCNGLECKVVKNNINLRLENIRLKRQIDEMAKTINEAYFGSGDFEEWFENKICKVQRYEDYTYLEKDIKQYFERKVENGN